MTYRSFEDLVLLLACPCCGSKLSGNGEHLECPSCTQEIGRIDDTIVFFDESIPDTFYSPEYTSSNGFSKNALSLLERHKSGTVLDIGAGLAAHDFPQVVQIELRRYRGTDVVFAGKRLPFKDNSFDAVLSQAVLEHVSDPKEQVAEIYRVLKPGGEVLLDAAFMQPLHGAPAHFFNSTEFGFQELFKDFSNVSLRIPPYLHPWQTVRLVLQHVVNGLEDRSDKEAFLNLRISELLERFAGYAQRCSHYRSENGSDLHKMAEWVDKSLEHSHDLLSPLTEISPEAQRKISAGFELSASKPLEKTSVAESTKRGVFSSPFKRRKVETEEVLIPAISQTDCSEHCGELLPTLIIEHNFDVSDRVRHIQIMFATFMRENTGRIVATLHNAGEEIESWEIDSSTVADNGFYELTVSKSYTPSTTSHSLKIRSMDSCPGNAVTLRLGRGSSLCGETTCNGQVMRYQLTCRVICMNTLRRFT